MKEGIEFNVALQIGTVIFKFNEDLLIRAKVISQLQVDQEMRVSAFEKLEQLREEGRNRLNDLIYKKKNRYIFSMSSPVFILPIRGTYEGTVAPIWVIRTGDVVFESLA